MMYASGPSEKIQLWYKYFTTCCQLNIVSHLTFRIDIIAKYVEQETELREM